jgi:BirA family biotin operon repressor/biotin-[acetyl-CoA-carboxylase] ligase
LAESTFDRAAFTARLATRRLGRTLVALGACGSTNDEAWEALAAGSPDGTVVVADTQSRGRGRAGRAWHTAPGHGLALSLLLHVGARPAGLLPLAAGLALAEALRDLGVATRLKWPNDVLARGRKLSGILAESRPLPRALRPGLDGDVAVVGVGVNVTQREEDFAPELRATATSLALEGHALTREAVAAMFLGRLETRWDALLADGRAALLADWRAGASFWGLPATVRTATGTLTGVARTLDDDGALVLALPHGGEITVLAGDLEVGWPEGVGA